MAMARMAILDSDGIPARNFSEFDEETDGILGVAEPSTASKLTRTNSKRIRRRRNLQHNEYSSRRASIVVFRTTATTTLLLLLLISCVSTTPAKFFVQASSLPFGRIHPKIAQKQSDSLSDDNALIGNTNVSIFGTRAGSSASFVGPASGGLAFESLSYYLKVALAGGVAGATGSAVLYPIDSAKTLRQSDPSAYSSVKDALFQMLRSRNAIQRVYKGILPAALGAIPSSALYFGAYESSKVTLQRILGDDEASETGYRKRLFVHGLAAASGNMLSSVVFVPKEVIKQQLQINKHGAAKTTIRSIVQEKGITGLYHGYGATLLRNIPSAVVRFVLYEELKRKWATCKQGEGDDERTQKLRKAGIFLAGAVAGSTSSFLMTPIDVVKTRLATGSCPLGVKNCMVHVVKEVGWKGLYAGAGSRVLWSGAFSAIGFGTFEMAKGYLGVGNSSTKSSTEASSSSIQEDPPKGIRTTTTLVPTKTLAKATIRAR